MGNNETKLNYFTRSPIAQSLATKLVGDPHRGRGVRMHPDGSASPPAWTLHNIAQGTASSVKDAENIFATLPDVELSMQILVSCILSPNDMRAPTLHWKNSASEIDPELSGIVLEELKQFFENDYNLRDILPTALEDALFKTGSYPLAVIPESSIDDIINNRNASIESLKPLLDAKHVLMGQRILGHGTSKVGKAKATKSTVGLESLFTSNGPTGDIDSEVATGISVTDNWSALKLPVALESFRSNKVGNVLSQSLKARSFGLEDAATLQQMANNLYRNPTSQAREMVRIRPAEYASRAPIGHPLVMKLPSESIIPVHIPSNVEQHVGYFILLDEFGNPVSVRSDSQYYEQIKNNQMNKGQRNAISNIINKTKRLTQGLCNENSNSQELTQAYTQMVELDLLERLRNGINGHSVEIQHPTEVYRIMMARSLAGKHTQLLYIPAELITYIAFDYNDYGIGRSLLEKSKLLAGIRALLTFANTMAAIKNSTNRRDLTVTVDDDDPEPERYVEMVLNEYAKVQSGAMPLATTNPLDIVDGIRNSQTTIKVQGSTAFPEVGLDVADGASTRVMVDDELSRRFRDDHYRSMGLAPEMVDSTVNVEYAASIVTSNQLMNKRIALYQLAVSGFLVDHVRKYTRSSGELMASIIKKINEYRKSRDATEEKVEAAKAQTPESVTYSGKELVLVEHDPSVKAKEEHDARRDSFQLLEFLTIWFDSLEITLPAPDTTRLENQLEQLTKYEEALDKVLPYYINEEVLGNVIPQEASGKMAQVTAAIKGVFIRQYLSQNNILPELKAMLSMDEDEQTLDIIDAHMTHASDLATTITKLMDALFKQHNPGVEPDAAGGGTDFGGDAGGDSFDGGGADDFGGDSFDDGLSADPLDETPTDTNEPSAEEPTEPTDDSKVVTDDSSNSDVSDAEIDDGLIQ